MVAPYKEIFSQNFCQINLIQLQRYKIKLISYWKLIDFYDNKKKVNIFTEGGKKC